jgi:N-acetylmuramoyl-L-alanine amidase
VKIMHRVVLDPGHGGDDPGAVSSDNLREKDITLKIALYAEEYLLKNYKVQVKLTRSNDVSVSLSDRCHIANKFKADLFVSIHVNAGEGTGFESYIYSETPGSTYRFQQVLHNAIFKFLEGYGLKNRGLKREGFTVLKRTNMPAVLTENLFIDIDYKLLKSESFLKSIGEAHAKGIATYLNLPSK